MSKLREILLTASETSTSLPRLEEMKIHNNITSVIHNIKPKVILHLGSLSHALECGKLVQSGSEILYARHLTPTIEDWISPERGKLRKNGIPNLYEAHMEYIRQEKLHDIITILNSDLSVIAELLMIKEIIPDIIMMDEGFDHIDPTIFTSPLTSLPLILQDFSFSKIKTKGNNNLLLNSSYYENILLQKNYVVASKNFETILSAIGQNTEQKPEKITSAIQERNQPERKTEVKQVVKKEEPCAEEKVIDKAAEEAELKKEEDNALKNEKRKKILEEKARVKAERRRRRAAASKPDEQPVEAKIQKEEIQNVEKSVAAPIAQEEGDRQAAPMEQKQAETVPQWQAAPAPQQQTAPAPQQQTAPAPQQQTAPAPQQQAAPIPQQQAARVQQQQAARVQQQQAARVQQQQAARVQQQQAARVQQQQAARVQQQQAAPAPQQQAAPVPQQQAAPVPQQQAAPVPQQQAERVQQQQAAPAEQGQATEQRRLRPRPIRQRVAAAQQQAPAPQQAAPVPQQREAIQQQAAQVAQQTAPLPTEGQQEDVVNSAKRALLQKRLRERLAK